MLFRHQSQKDVRCVAEVVLQLDYEVYVLSSCISQKLSYIDQKRSELLWC